MILSHITMILSHITMILADGVTDKVTTVMSTIETDMTAIGGGALVLGLAAGGLMRLFAYGNERRIAMSNTALSCAVIGFVILMLATVAGPVLEKIFQ